VVDAGGRPVDLAVEGVEIDGIGVLREDVDDVGEELFGGALVGAGLAGRRGRNGLAVRLGARGGDDGPGYGWRAVRGRGFGDRFGHVVGYERM
jgi:hypothetical protein